MINTSQRTCAICKAKKPKEKLFRFLVNKQGVGFDKNQEKKGRGFYVCSKKCWDRGVKKNKRIKYSSQENKFITLPNISFEKMVRI